LWLAFSKKTLINQLARIVKVAVRSLPVATG